MADGTFVLILLSPGWCRLVHLTWGNNDSKDGSFKNSLFGKFLSLFFGKHCLCCEENAGIERIHPFPDFDVKSANMEVCVAKPQICAKSGSGVGRCNCSMGANVIPRSYRVRLNVTLFFLSLTLRGACLEDVFFFIATETICLLIWSIFEQTSRLPFGVCVLFCCGALIAAVM